MTFGETVRQLRHAKQLTLRALADRVGVGFTYISKIENHKLEDGHGPSEKLIHKLAVELDANPTSPTRFLKNFFSMVCNSLCCTFFPHPPLAIA